VLAKLLPEAPDADWAAVLAAAGERGRGLLLDWLARAGMTNDPEALAAALGPCVARAPLRALRALSGTQAARDALRGAHVPAAELAAELVSQRDLSWRRTLVEALAELPARPIVFEPGDPHAEPIRNALGALRREPEACASVRAWLDAHASDSGKDVDAIRSLLLGSLARQMTAKELLSWSRLLEPEERALAIAGLGRVEAGELLAGLTYETWFDPALLSEARVDELADELVDLARRSPPLRPAILARLLARPERAERAGTKVALLHDRDERALLAAALARLAASARARGDREDPAWAWRRRGVE
jgi:hypothetical protein